MREVRDQEHQRVDLDVDDRSSIAGGSSQMDLRNNVSKLAKIVKARSDLKYASIKK